MQGYARLSTALFVAIATIRGTAHGQVPGEEIARRAFEEGVILEKKGNYAEALAKFKESARVRATLGNRFHTAYCLEMSGKLAAAFIEYETVDRSAREQNKPDIINATHLRLEPLRVRVPQLVVRATARPNGLEVLLDGEAVAPSLLEGQPFLVDPGEHTIVARAPDHETFAKQLTAPESATVSVEIALQPIHAATARPEAAPIGSTSAPPAPLEARPRSRVLPILTSVGAVALAAGGVAAFVLSGNAQDDARATCPTKLSCDAERNNVRMLDTFALGGFLGAAGLAALSVVLWVAQPGAGTGATAALRLRTKPAWVGLESSF